MKQEKKEKRVQNTREKEESLSYTVEVRDKEGKVIKRISAPSRSYVKAWNQILNIHAAQATKQVIKTDGTPYNLPKGNKSLNIDAAVGNGGYGIVVGKGTTAVTIDDYNLESLCGEGTGTDEFNYQGVGDTIPAVIGSTCSFTLSRLMINNSGATISGIREIGGIVLGFNYGYLGFRDVLPSPVSVPHGGSITVIYTIAVTV